jgi:hypothetical protein
MTTGPTRRPIGRRTALAGLAGLAGAVLAGAGLLALDGVGDTAGGSAPEVPIRLHTDWTRHATGPLPAAGDEGVPFVLRDSAALGRPRVADGALVADLPDSHSAVYVDQPVGRVRRLGARVGFVPGPGGRATGDGSVCLAAWSGALPPSDPGVYSAPVHFVMTPDRWLYGVVTDSAVHVVAEERFATPLPVDGTPVTVEVVLDGTRAVLTLPDGTTRRVEHPAITQLTAPVACWEFYRDAPGGAAVRLYQTWAG